MSPSRVSLGDIAEFVNGVAFKPDDWEESGKRILRIQNLTDSTKPFNRTNRVVAKKYEVAPGDLLVSWSATLGVFVWEGPDTALVNQHIFRVVPDHGRIDPRYLRHMLSDALVQMKQHLHGATMKHVNRGEFLATTIPLPPLGEQKRIARILDAADALLAKRREALAQLDTRVLQSTFLDMFGDPVTNPMGWEVRSLGDLAVKKPNNGVFRRNPEYSESLDSGLPVVWVVELFRGNRIDVSESRRLEATQTEIEKYGLLPGDLLFCRSSLKLDGIAYNNVFLGKREEALFECHLIRVSPRTDVVNPVFLNLQLRSVPMRALLKSKSKTATMTTIDQKALSSVGVVVPPVGRQSRFAAVVESVEQQRARQRAHLAELDTLFASLQSRAFRGDL